MPKSCTSGTWRKYPGASAGQSPLVHTIDVALGIVHRSMNRCPMSGMEPSCPPSPVSVCSDPGEANPMMEMRLSLPGEYQDFIKRIGKGPSIRAYCNSSDPELHEAFNRCCMGMKVFRDVHLQLASRYIVAKHKGAQIVGTGGTDLVPFLKQTRRETLDTMI